MIEVNSTIPVWMVLFTNLENFKLSMQYAIKEKKIDKDAFLHHLSTKPNATLNGGTTSMWKTEK